MQNEDMTESGILDEQYDALVNALAKIANAISEKLAPIMDAILPLMPYLLTPYKPPRLHRKKRINKKWLKRAGLWKA